MRKILKCLMVATLLSLPVVLNAQTENPRGIYRLMTLVGKNGEVNSPFHQYKVCTDSLTLMVVFRNNSFSISNNDRMVFNYTGSEPKSEEDKSILIYDSNAEHFTEKWWSDFPNHMIFPYNDWCLEKYQSGQYTKESRIAFDAMTGKAEVDASNPLTGTWRFIGYVDEIRDIKKELPKLHEKYPESRYFNSFYVFSPKNCVALRANGGVVDEITYDGKKAFTVGNVTYQVKWLSKDRIAVEEHIDYRTDWQIMERVTDEQQPLSHINSQYTQRGPRALR